MKTIRVRLRDKSSCFYDQKNQIFISNPGPVEVPHTPKIAEGLRYGALVEVKDDDEKPKKDAENTQEGTKNEEKTDLEKRSRKAYAIIKSLSEDKPDYEATDYDVLKEWVNDLGLTPASKKKEDYIAALKEAVAEFEADKD